MMPALIRQRWWLGGSTFADPSGALTVPLRGPDRSPTTLDRLIPSRSVESWASVPEFSEPPCRGLPLVVTGTSGGRTRRQIHHVAAECIAGVAVRQDRFDPTTGGAQFVG